MIIEIGYICINRTYNVFRQTKHSYYIIQIITRIIIKYFRNTFFSNFCKKVIIKFYFMIMHVLPYLFFMFKIIKAN